MKPSERGSLRSNASTLQPQSRPFPTSRPSQSWRHERASPRPQPETDLSHKKRDFFRPGRASVMNANRSSTAGISPRNEDQRERERERGKRLQPKQVQEDLYIPSTISVGQLAKLLNVRLRMYGQPVVPFTAN